MPANENNTVKRTLDPNNPPRLSPEQEARLNALSEMPDTAIDYSDAPHLPDALWLPAARVPCAKQQITLRIDADVLDFFRHTGRRYQTRINAVLRSYMEAVLRSAP
jgi:uncharacterized protein (DUF4415 family)